MEVIILGLISALRPATSQAAVFAMLRAPAAARTLFAFALAGLTASILFGLIAVGAFTGADDLVGESTVADVFDILAGVAALSFAAGVQRGGLDRRRERTAGRGPGKATAAITARLSNPSVVTAATAGVATHIPGLIYLVVLNAIAAGNPGPVSALTQVVIYNLLWFAIPLGALVLVLRSPATATGFVDGLTAWARSHQDLLLVVIFGALGIYLLAKGVVGLL